MLESQVQKSAVNNRRKCGVLLNCVIEATYFIAPQELPFGACSEIGDSGDRMNYANCYTYQQNRVVIRLITDSNSGSWCFS